MKEIIGFLIVVGSKLGIFFIILIGFLFIYTTYHEETHKQINEYYNVESEIEYSILRLGGKTITINKTNEICPEQRNLAHSITEAIGYHVRVLVMILAVIVFVLINNRTYQNEA